MEKAVKEKQIKLILLQCLNLRVNAQLYSKVMTGSMHTRLYDRIRQKKKKKGLVMHVPCTYSE